MRGVSRRLCRLTGFCFRCRMRVHADVLPFVFPVDGVFRRRHRAHLELAALIQLARQSAIGIRLLRPEAAMVGGIAFRLRWLIRETEDPKECEGRQALHVLPLSPGFLVRFER
jgi:hypothetical protein